MTTKKIRGSFTDGGNGRCALGAAIDATGAKVLGGSEGFTQAGELFPLLRDGSCFNDIAWWVVSWNDRHDLSREQIANYVEMMEDHDGYLQTGINADTTESKPLELIAQEAK